MTEHPATWAASLRRALSANALASRRGALALFVLAFVSYALQALAWPLERGRDSWDYWLWLLQALDTDPPFSALAVFRTPLTPIVVGLPMAIGGAQLLELVMGLIYAATIVGWAWAVLPLGRRVAVAVGVVMLVNVPFAGLFHEVSSDFVFAALMALFAGWVIRAFSTPTRRHLALVGVGVALLTLCRPTGQVAVIACVLIPLLARRGWRPRLTGIAVGLVAAALPLGLWAVHNSVRYDDFTVARGGKAWVPFFKVAGSVDPANGDASKRLADAVAREVLTQPAYAERGVDTARYFRGAGNLEVIRMIALSDRVFGWDSDYEVLYDASIETIRKAPGWYARDVGATFWDFLSQRYAPEPRSRPVTIPSQPSELTIDGKPFPAPITVSPLVEAVRYGLVWCPTDELERCVVSDPAAALGSASQGKRYTELIGTIRDWNAQLPLRDSNAWLASKGGTASFKWPRSYLWIALAVVALAIRRPRGTASVVMLGVIGALVLLVHALSQAPQNEFALPVAPIWIVAALVGLLGVPKRPSLRMASRVEPPLVAGPGEPPTRVDVIRRALRSGSGGAYLEIGVRDGVCFEAIDAPTRVGVDPAFTFRVPVRAWLRTKLRASSGTQFFRMTSDRFFSRHAHRLGPFSVVFVDGLHTAEQAYRDIVNALGVLEQDGVVIVHDCNPQSMSAAAPTLEEAVASSGYDGLWNGDVYKAMVRLRTRDDLRVIVLDADQGLGIVSKRPATARLILASNEIDALDYAAFSRNRERLIDLRPHEDLDALLDRAGTD